MRVDGHEAQADVVVVGAGQAGLAVSYYLTEARVRHVVLERGRIGESWRSQRWDSFCLNTPNWSNGLPGLPLSPEAPEAFAPRDELVSYLERYALAFDLPVQQNTPVTAVRRLPSDLYQLDVDDRRILATAVVLATGSMSRPRVPEVATDLPDDVLSLAAGEFRRAERLPPGSVLVVGSGQSGCQIVEDLLASGRTVYLCASRVGRVPRVYRGREILEWWRDMGFLDVAVDDLEDPSARFATQPQVSGTEGGHTVSLQSLARDGATLLGRAEAVRGGKIVLGGDLMESISFADEKSRSFKEAVDAWIEAHGIDAGPPEDDPGEPPLPDLKGSDRLSELDLRDAGVGCVIWCTGYDADWSWLRVDVLDEWGRPRHQGGVTAFRGLYFIGHPWLSKRSSGILFGVKDDAQRIVEHLRRNVLGDGDG